MRNAATDNNKTCARRSSHDDDDICVHTYMCAMPIRIAVQTVVVRACLIQCGTERTRGFRTLTGQLRRIVIRRSLTRRFLVADKTMKIVRVADVIDKTTSHRHGFFGIRIRLQIRLQNCITNTDPV